MKDEQHNAAIDCRCISLRKQHRFVAPHDKLEMRLPRLGVWFRIHLQGGVMEMQSYRVQKPDDINVILGQSHFIKTVEDIHEALVNAVPGIKFGVAFCEASGPALVRWSGTDDAMIALARENAFALGAGHSFFVFLGAGFYPLNVLRGVQSVPEVCRIFCATANPLEVIFAQTTQGRAILGVVDGVQSKGIEGDAEIAERKALLRRFGYKM
jgi:adenosine/AMP kinase